MRLRDVHEGWRLEKTITLGARDDVLEEEVEVAGNNAAQLCQRRTTHQEAGVSRIVTCDDGEHHDG